MEFDECKGRSFAAKQTIFTGSLGNKLSSGKFWQMSNLVKQEIGPDFYLCYSNYTHAVHAKSGRAVFVTSAKIVNAFDYTN